MGIQYVMPSVLLKAIINADMIFHLWRGTSVFKDGKTDVSMAACPLNMTLSMKDETLACAYFSLHLKTSN